MTSSPTLLQFGRVTCQVFSSKDALGAAAATRAATIIRDAVAASGRARILVATGNSQIEMMTALVARADVPWDKVDAFHLDEYVGITPDHPASFRHWIRHRFELKARPGSMRYIQGDAAHPDQEAKAYGDALFSAPVDLAFVGIGENGHIAFNDPPVADFNDPLMVKRVELDAACRRQQVGEGHFPDLNAVPREALTVTCSGLMRAKHWICCVPDARKANAVQGSLEGPVTPACPGSLVQRHPRAEVYLDEPSAARLARR